MQYCSACSLYVKTVDLRDGDEGVLLPLEDIATVLLDRAAAERGLEPPRAFLRSFGAVLPAFRRGGITVEVMTLRPL